MLYGVAPRNSDPIHFASQLLGEERLLALEDKRDQVHDKFTQRQADKWSPELDYKKLILCLQKEKRNLKSKYHGMKLHILFIKYMKIIPMT